MLVGMIWMRDVSFQKVSNIIHVQRERVERNVWSPTVSEDLHCDPVANPFMVPVTPDINEYTHTHIYS